MPDVPENLESVIDMLDQASFDELMNIISLGGADQVLLESIDDEDFSIAFSGLQIIMAEICRYAIHSILSSNQYTPLAPLADGQEVAIQLGYEPFHTRRLNHWVEQKSRAILLPYGVSEANIRRGLMIVLSKNYNRDRDDERRWEEQDRFLPSYLETGEILRVRNGQNLPSPDRLIYETHSQYAIPIISAKPTRMLLNMIESAGCENTQIEHRGMMRILYSTNQADFDGLNALFTVTQPVSSYVSIPPMLYSLLSESLGIDEATQEGFLNLLNEQIRPVSFQQLRNELEDADVKSASRDTLSPSYAFNRVVNVETGHGFTQYGVVRAKFQISSNRYFFTIDSDRNIANGTSIMGPGTMRVFEIPPSWYRYALRLFSADRAGDDPPLAIQNDATHFNLNRFPFASGYRLLMLYGASRVLNDEGEFRGEYTCPADQINTLVSLLRAWNFYGGGEHE